MRKSSPLLLFLFFVGTGLPQDVPPSAESADFTISADVELVVLDVSVKDAKGGYASGLSKDDFKVFDNGKLQPIKHFSPADLPVTVGLVVDNSGSMRSKRAEVITAAITFVHASNPEDEIFVVNFNDTVRRGLPSDVLFSDDIGSLRKALWNGPAEGRTSLYDALGYSIQHLEKGKMGKKTLVLVSDGGDNASTLRSHEVIRRVEESLATIYTLGIFDEDDRDRNPGFLKQLAEVSGGEYFRPSVLKEVAPVCLKIAADIRSRYTIAYSPPHLNAKQAAHSIKVVASTPSRSHLTVHTRSRYIEPHDGKKKEHGR